MKEKKSNSDKLKDILKELPSFCSSYFTKINNDNYSELTRLYYAMDIKEFLEYEATQLGKEMSSITLDDLDKLNRIDFDEFIAYAKDLGRKDDGKEGSARASTTARRIASLRSFFNYYFENDQLAKNYTSLLSKPKINANKIIILTPEETDRLMEAILDTEGMDANELAKHNLVEKRDYAIISLFLQTGLRVSELCNINVKDIDWHNCQIYVRRKGGDIDITYFASKTEERLRDYFDNGREALLNGKKDEPAFFISMQHNRLSTNAIRKLIYTYGTKAGINPEKLTPHKLRKTAGSRLLEESNGNIDAVAAVLHHKSITTTKKYYAKTSEETKREAAKLLDDILK